MKSLPTHALGIHIVARFPGTMALTVARADDFKPEPGYVSLFNGHDLTGWGCLTNHFHGHTKSSGGR